VFKFRRLAPPFGIRKPTLLKPGQMANVFDADGQFD
jgi:hypothetical protein